MRILRAQMPRRPDYDRSHRAALIPWVYSSGALSNTTFGGSPPDNDPGDMILTLAGATSTDIIPTLATGHTLIDSDNSGGLTTVAALLCFKISTVTNDSVGGIGAGKFDNANKIAAVVMKGARTEDDGTVNGVTLLSTAAALFTYPALTLTGNRLIMLGHMADDSEAPHPFPAGFTTIITKTTPEIAIAVSDVPLSSWPGATVAQVGNNPAITFACAIRGDGGQFR